MRTISVILVVSQNCLKHQALPRFICFPSFSSSIFKATQKSLSPVQKDRKVKNKTSYRFNSFKGKKRSANMASVVVMVTTVQEGLNLLPWPTLSCCSAFILIAPPHTTCSSCICSCFPPFVQPFVLLCDYLNPFGPVNYIFTATRCSRTLVWMQILKCCYALEHIITHGLRQEY